MTERPVGPDQAGEPGEPVQLEELGEPGQPDARFLLASERTLLAWLRTAMTFVALGVALVTLRHFGSNDRWPMVAAAASCVFGVVTALWAYWHWRQIDTAIRAGTPLPRTTNVAAVVVAGVLVIAAAGLIAVVARL